MISLQNYFFKKDKKGAKCTRSSKKKQLYQIFLISNQVTVVLILLKIIIFYVGIVFRPLTYKCLRLFHIFSSGSVWHFRSFW